MNHDTRNETTLRRVTVDENGSWYYHTMDSPADLTSSLVLAVSDVLGEDIEDLEPPLYEIINPDGLNTIFDTIGDSGMASAVSVQLHLWGLDMTIYSDGWIVIDSRSEDDKA